MSLNRRQRAQIASRLGADAVFNPGNTDIVREITAATGKGADVAFVCSAAPAVLQQAVTAVRTGGAVVIAGGGLSAEVSAEYWMWKEVEVRGSFAYVDEFDAALELFTRGLRVERVEGAGHFLHQEKPEQGNQLILQRLEAFQENPHGWRCR